MGVNEIISELYQDEKIDKCISQFARPSDREDLKQDLFIILLGKEEQLIQSLHQKKELFFYSIRVIVNLYKKKYRNQKIVCPVVDIADVEESEDTKQAYLEAFNQIDEKNGFPYFKKLVDLIIEHGSQRKVAKVTGIPLMSINDSVQYIRKYLKSKV